MVDLGIAEYINLVWKEQHKEWKYELHCYYKTCESPDAAPTDPLMEIQESIGEWK